MYTHLQDALFKSFLSVYNILEESQSKFTQRSDCKMFRETGTNPRLYRPQLAFKMFMTVQLEKN